VGLGVYKVASDGEMFAVAAPLHGSTGGKPLNEPIGPWRRPAA